MSGSGRSGNEGVTRVLSFDDSYVDGIGFFCRSELVNIEPEKSTYIIKFNIFLSNHLTSKFSGKAYNYKTVNYRFSPIIAPLLRCPTFYL